MDTLQVIVPQLQHSCSQPQLSDILNLVESCQQAEYALTQGMEKLHQIHDNAAAAGDKGLKLSYVAQQMIFIKQVLVACTRIQTSLYYICSIVHVMISLTIILIKIRLLLH